jgi:hypothetical protein
LRLLEAVEDAVEAVDLGVGALADVRHLALGRLLDAPCGADVGLGALGLELGQVGLELLGAGLDLGVATVRRSRFFSRSSISSRARAGPRCAVLLVDRGDHVRREVDDLLEVLRGEVEQVAQADGTPLKYQMWVTGAASSMWPIRSRRTLARVTSTPQRSQMMPLKRTRLYLPQ